MSFPEEILKIDAYIQEVFENYDDWMPVATVHAHVLDYMKEDDVRPVVWPRIEQVSRRVGNLIDKHLLEWKNLSTQGGMCLMVRRMRR